MPETASGGGRPMDEADVQAIIDRLGGVEALLEGRDVCQHWGWSRCMRPVCCPQYLHWPFRDWRILLRGMIL